MEAGQENSPIAGAPDDTMPGAPPRAARVPGPAAEPTDAAAGALSETDSTLIECAGDPNTTLIFTVGIVGAILLLALLVFGAVLFQNAQALQTEEKVFAGKPVELSEQQTLQLAAINQYRYISERDGIVAIPIGQAIDLFVACVQADPRQASPAGSPSTQPARANPATQPGSAP